MKKKLFLFCSCFLVIVVFLTAYFVFRDTGVKSVRVSKISKLIFHKDELVPGTGFVWNMGIDDFLSKVYGADTLKPDSQSFDKYRYSYQEEISITTLRPPLLFSIDNIPGSAQVTYAFDENGLYASVYSWIYNNDSEVQKLESVKKAVEVLMDDLNSNPHIIANYFDIPDLSKSSEGDFPYKFKWLLTKQSHRYIELSISKLQYSYIISFTIGNRHWETSYNGKSL